MMNQLPAPGEAGAGFTLLEVLIAFVIASLALSVVFGAGLESLRGVAIASRYEQAVSRARSHLDAAGARLVVRDEQGDDGSGFRWHETIRAVETSRLHEGSTPATRFGAPATLTLYAITARITWRDGKSAREVRLDTSRLGAAAADAWSGTQLETEAPPIPED